jgi:hypothetical protein
MLFLLPSAAQLGQDGTIKSSYGTLSSRTTYKRVFLKKNIVSVQSGRKGSRRNIAIGICLGLRACALQLSDERVPARVGLAEPLLKHCAWVDVSILTMHFLLFAIRLWMPPKFRKAGENGKLEQKVIVCAGGGGGSEGERKWELLQKCFRGVRECVCLLRVLVRCGGVLRGAGHRRSG